MQDTKLSRADSTPVSSLPVGSHPEQSHSGLPPSSAEPPSNCGGVSRRTFLKTALAAGAALATPGLASMTAQALNATASRRNLIIFMTDQERYLQWFPEGWGDEHLLATKELKATGVSFKNAFCNTAMCTPSRATFFTGTYPSQHLCKDTLTEDFAQSDTERQLNPKVPNLATILKDAGYEVVYKGKWHLSKGAVDADGNHLDDDISRYLFDGWNPPDAGQDVKMTNFGGGDADHDEDYVEQAIEYLQGKLVNPGTQPFCLVVSLVNPHDVLSYPGNSNSNWEDGGYDPSYLLGDIEIPPTAHENLLTNFKPTCQETFLIKSAGLGPVATDIRKRNYLNFYGNLMIKNDQKLLRILQLLSQSEEGRELRRKTWIVRTADHGEMGMCHGGLRQKAFQCYEESIRVPMIWSNTEDYPQGTGKECKHLVSHVDFIPTVCSALLGAGNWAGSYNLSGVDYQPLLRSPLAARGVQDYILFTFDDIYAGQDAGTNPGGLVTGANRIEMIRTADFKYARYYDATGVAEDQEEFYDLRPASANGTDCDASTGEPLELTNYSLWAEKRRKLAGTPLTAPRDITTQRANLPRLLTTAKRRALLGRSAGVAEAPVVTQQESTTEGGDPVHEIFWYSLATTLYQVESSTNGVDWQPYEAPIPGNNGPILVSIVNPPANTTYRVLWGPASA